MGQGGVGKAEKSKVWSGRGVAHDVMFVFFIEICYNNFFFFFWHFRDHLQIIV